MRKPPPINNQKFLDAVQAADAGALVALYDLVVRFGPSTWRIVADWQLDDVIHDAYLVLLANIQRGDIRDPAYLFGYVRQILRRTAFNALKRRVNCRADVSIDGFNEIPLVLQDRMRDPDESPEEQLLRLEKFKLTSDALGMLPQRDQEILTRFYVRGESLNEICDAMGITHDQCRRFKCRAKNRVEAILTAYLQSGELPQPQSIAAIDRQYRLQREKRHRANSSASPLCSRPARACRQTQSY